MADELRIGDIQFYDDYLPGLAAGDYKITVKQDIADIGITQSEKDQLIAAQKFIVSAPQFNLDPAEIHSMVPPFGSTGKYADELPHIVLNKQVLPWERQMSHKNIPWMALLVFQDNELIPDTTDNTDPETKAIRTTVGQFLQLKSADLFTPSIIKEDDIPDSQACSYIQLSTDNFKKVIPYLSELPYLAHVRQVNTGDKVIMGIRDEGWFGVVTANRFPASQADDTVGIKNIVHLVSLEGMDNYLKADPGISQGKVALLSLASWTFRCLPDSKEDFRGLMLNLVASEQDNAAYHPERLWLRLPQPDLGANPDAVKTEIAKRLQDGYVPVAYHTRSGEDTFAWYRGPLTPVLPTLLAKPQPFFTADAALIYDKTNGLFDQSLASAWQVGRNLALADQNFGKLLLDFRRKSHRLTDTLYDNLVNLGLDSEAAISQLVGSNLMQKAFLQLLENDLLGEIPKKPLATGNAPAPKTVNTPQNPVQALQDFLGRDDVKNSVQSATKDDLEPIAQWLARKQLLYDIPFNYLVPDTRLLPVESIRFFYVDQNWLDAMLDGMLAIALHSSRDTFYHQLTKDMVREAVEDAAKSIRNSLTGLDADPSSDKITHMSGFLLRSAVVSGWPGLAVRAFDAQGNQLKILRLDHLSANVLLGIFWGIPDRIDFSEPQEGFQFGMSEEGDLNLRSIVKDNSTYPFGAELNDHYAIRGKHLRPGNILDLRPEAQDGIVQGITGELKKVLKLDTLTLQPSDFALQMVKSPERITFKAPAGA